jgi:Na+-transporting NADH:ubiquinone oxidoreductase subunit NqrF
MKRSSGAAGQHEIVVKRGNVKIVQNGSRSKIGKHRAGRQPLAWLLRRSAGAFISSASGRRGTVTAQQLRISRVHDW